MRALVIKETIDTMFRHPGFDSGRYEIVLTYMSTLVGPVYNRRKTAPNDFMDAFPWDELTDAQVMEVLCLTMRRFAIQR